MSTAWSPMTEAERLIYAAAFAQATAFGSWEGAAERAFQAVMTLRKAQEEATDKRDSRHGMLRVFLGGGES